MQTECRKFGIKCVNLSEYDPDFSTRISGGKIEWEDIPRNFNRIRTFLIFIAKIKFNEYKVYSCLPHKYAAEYYVFVDIDDGALCMLVSTIRDDHQYPDSGLRIGKLQEELLLLDADSETLSALRASIIAS